MAFVEYVNEKANPRRDDRLRTCHAYGGTACGLVKDSQGGCLVNKDRSFSQTFGCQMSLSMFMLQTIPDTVSILHGPVGCGGASPGRDYRVREGNRARGLKEQRVIWYNTNLNESDVINGGEDSLEKTILAIEERHHPKAIFIVSTCVPGIIGDDVDALAAQLQERVKAKLIPLHCEGFKTKIVATAYDAVYHGIARHLIDDQEDAPAEAAGAAQGQADGLIPVNVFNFSSMGRIDEVELARLLKGIGLEANFFPNYVHPDAFNHLKKAALNISVCATHDDYFLEYLKEKFGTPYLIGTMPIGSRNTSEWLLAIAGKLGKEEVAQQFITAETKELEAALAPYQERFQGKRVYISGGEIRVPATGMLMQELGFKVIGLRAHHYDEFGDDLYLKVAENDPDMEVNVATTQPFELVNLLNRAKPDLYIGHAGSNVYAAKLGIPGFPLFNTPKSYYGYRGAYEVALQVDRLLRNQAYQRKLKEHTRNPYHESWYQQDPYHYITG
ncbi:nitrogenase component 1 [Heliophilum fasciatum]|uniref:Nitrogenase molybdenum-iron protein alpha chain n=1 Tax=Heliophilum fasciatum TaxID=35700 RepID=A0A4R2RPQ2_9FIRM|nr:nitrogenase component 1 [Heliophilum fasciatum]MCW2277691.1 nitrogenase molybdenum-iron protein alpha chain [Heliophilum fasciatum]TCP65038.1 nitrogenase molybdenum-iron protein alpha chain [Heliophilum fasciatum]